jgi:hypothetical protein
VITYYHKHASDKAFGPGDQLARHIHSHVLHIDVFHGDECLGPKRRLNPLDLARARVRLGVTYERSDAKGKPQPDAWAFLPMHATRSEIRAVWFEIDEAGIPGDATAHIAQCEAAWERDRVLRAGDGDELAKLRSKLAALAAEWFAEADRIPKYEKYDHSIPHVKAAVITGERIYRRLASDLRNALEAKP